MRLMTRMMAAIVVTVLAALTLYFVFLHGKSPADDEVQPVHHHVGYSPGSAAASLRYPMRVSE
jgi:heme/copper-type cytochrome/quinol oxidase subunit 2